MKIKIKYAYEKYCIEAKKINIKQLTYFSFYRRYKERGDTIETILTKQNCKKTNKVGTNIKMGILLKDKNIYSFFDKKNDADEFIKYCLTHSLEDTQKYYINNSKIFIWKYYLSHNSNQDKSKILSYSYFHKVYKGHMVDMLKYKKLKRPDTIILLNWYNDVYLKQYQGKLLSISSVKQYLYKGFTKEQLITKDYHCPALSKSPYSSCTNNPVTRDNSKSIMGLFTKYIDMGYPIDLILKGLKFNYADYAKCMKIYLINQENNFTEGEFLERGKQKQKNRFYYFNETND